MGVLCFVCVYRTAFVYKILTCAILFYGFAPGDFTEIENILDVGVHEYGSKVCQEK